MSAYYDSYPPSSSIAAPPNQAAAKEEDTEAVASFLLSLKHSRSVTPDPSLDDSDHHSQATLASQPPPQHQAFHGYSQPQLQLQPQAQCPPHYTYEPRYAEVQQMPPQACHQRARQQRPQGLPPSMFAPTRAQGPAPSDVPSFESMIGSSKLVLMKDRDLVPDSLFVAMAQMKPCKLTHADRVGCYKTRDIGFIGMSCKHCGGQPGFGRYYPNSVRSLAQTTTSQTILKHISGKCRFCPPAIRNAVLQLQAHANACEGLSTGRPRYGSRKIFFQRVWARLHDLDEDKADDLSTQTPSDVDEPEEVSEEETRQTKRKNRFGALPLKKNKRAKATVALE